jgi:HK97 family phage major capsid protein
MSSLGLSRKEKSQYNIVKAILAAARGDWQSAPFERVVSLTEYERRGVMPASARSFAIPRDILERDLTATAAPGAYLVGTEQRPSTFIDLMRADSLVDALNVTRLGGLVGNVTIQKITAGTAGYWLPDENTQITASQPTIGQLALAPKNVGGLVVLSHQFAKQNSEGAQSFVLRDAAAQLRLAIDLALIGGSGAGGQPTGVASVAAGAFTGTSLDFAKLLDAQSDLAANNALNESCAYVTTPTVAALLAARVRFASTASPLWDGSLSRGTVLGHRAFSSTSVPAGTAIFGDFSQVVLGEWDGLEILANPFADFSRGLISVRAFAAVDVGVRAPGAFSVATGCT